MGASVLDLGPIIMAPTDLGPIIMATTDLGPIMATLIMAVPPVGLITMVAMAVGQTMAIMAVVGLIGLAPNLTTTMTMARGQNQDAFARATVILVKEKRQVIN